MINTVLIVDDSNTDRANMDKIIKGAGYTTLMAENGEKAIEVVKSRKPDLILMDVNMPVMDGFAATRKLQNDPETKSIPVVLVTSKDQKADKAWGKMLGAKGYVTKPYNEQDVLSVVKSL